MVSGISHLTYIVRDLDAATRFFEEIFRAELVYSSGEKQFSRSEERFFLIGEVWVCIMQGESLKDRTYNHTAFRIPDMEFEEYLSRIESLGVDILPGRSRVTGEGRSVYFHDYDNHLFELHTGTLEERLKRYAKE